MNTKHHTLDLLTRQREAARADAAYQRSLLEDGLAVDEQAARIMATCCDACEKKWQACIEWVARQPDPKETT